MLQYDFEASVGYWLSLATHAFHRALNDELAPHGITYRQSQVLGWLVLEGELSQADLANRMMIEPPTLAGILDRMERSGWITREPCAHDRRKNVVQPNPAAEDVWEKIVECALKVRTQATKNLPPDQIATVIDVLQTIHNNLGACPIPTHSH